MRNFWIIFKRKKKFIKLNSYRRGIRIKRFLSQKVKHYEKKLPILQQTSTLKTMDDKTFQFLTYNFAFIKKSLSQFSPYNEFSEIQAHSDATNANNFWKLLQSPLLWNNNRNKSQHSNFLSDLKTNNFSEFFIYQSIFFMGVYLFFCGWWYLI